MHLMQYLWLRFLFSYSYSQYSFFLNFRKKAQLILTKLYKNADLKHWYCAHTTFNLNYTYEPDDADSPNGRHCKKDNGIYFDFDKKTSKAKQNKLSKFLCGRRINSVNQIWDSIQKCQICSDTYLVISIL